MNFSKFLHFKETFWSKGPSTTRVFSRATAGSVKAKDNGAENKHFFDHLNELLKSENYAALLAELDSPKNKKYSIPDTFKIRAYRRAGLRKEAVELGKKVYNSKTEKDSELATEYLWSLVSVGELEEALSIALDFVDETEIKSQSMAFVHVLLRVLYSRKHNKDILYYTSKFLKFGKSSSILHAYRASAAYEEKDLETYTDSIEFFKLNDLPPAHFALEKKLFFAQTNELLKAKEYDTLLAELDDPKNNKYSIPAALRIRAYRRAGLRKEAVELGEKFFNSNDKNSSELTSEYLWSLVSIGNTRKAASIALYIVEESEITDQSLAFIHVFLRVLYLEGRTKAILAYTSNCLKFGKTSSVLYAYRASAAFEEKDLEIYASSIANVKLEDLPPAHFVLKRNLAANFKNNFPTEERGPKLTILGSPRFAGQPALEASYNTGNYSILLNYYSNLPDDELLELLNFFTFVDAATHSRQLSVLKGRLRRFKDLNKLNRMHAEKLRVAAHLVDNDSYLLKFSTSILLKDENYTPDFGLNYILQLEAAVGPNERRQILIELMEKQKNRLFPEKLKVFLLSKAELLKNEVKQFPGSENICEFIDSINDSIDLENNRHQVQLERNLLDLIYSSISIATNPKVSLISPIYRQEDIPILKENFLRQSWANLELVIIANGQLYNDQKIVNAFSDIENVKLLNACDLSVGAYLNMGIKASTGDIIMRFDSDDFYLKEFVKSNVLMLEHHRADVIGQKSYFVFIEDINLLVRYQATRTDYFQEWKFAGPGAMGASMAFRRSVFDRVKFNETIALAEDRVFAFSVFSLGYKCIDIDPFNMVVRRRSNKVEHTWNASDTYLLSNAMIVGRESDIFSLGTPLSL